MNNSEYVTALLLSQLDLCLDTQKLLYRLNDHPDFPSMLAITDTLHEWGIKNAAFRVSAGDLLQVEAPFIAHMLNENGQGEHVVVQQADPSQLIISSHRYQERKISHKEFERNYRGIVLMIDSGCLPKLRTTGSTVQKNPLNHLFPYTQALSHPLTYLDIGASYGLSAKWQQYVGDPLFNLILVEPDPGQAEILEAIYPQATIIREALGDLDRETILNITASQACSSVLDPDMDILERFPIGSAFRIVERMTVNLARFDRVAERLKPGPVDFVKIDVQGFEFKVLEGFGSALDNVLGIEMETHLTPIYKGEQPLHEINHYLRQRGFFLRHLEPVGAFEGEAIEFNAYFMRYPELVSNENNKQLIELWQTINQIPPAKKSNRFR